MTDSGLIGRIRASGRLWNIVLFALDAAVVILATLIAYYARFEGSVPLTFSRWTPAVMIAALVVYLALFAAFGLYRLVLRYVGVDTLVRISAAVFLGFALLLLVALLVPTEFGMRIVPVGVLFIQAVLVFVGASADRVTARVIFHLRGSRGRDRRRVLIVGAGNAGSLLLRDILARPDLELGVVGFLDDSPRLIGRTINGVPVLGPTSALQETLQRRKIAEVIVAMPSASRETVRRILNVAADSDVETRIMPSIVIARGSVSLRDLRSVDVEDLLGREPTPIDVDQVRETIAGKVVAVTGAAGSIGSELCRQIAQLGPKALLLIEIDETRLYELWLELRAIDADAPIMCLCDIRDADRLGSFFDTFRPELVLHAAAYKHVPLIELAPAEAVKTNVLGTRNVIEACEKYDAERFVLISTDKAVAPANVMGLTKSFAERVMLDASRRSDLSTVAVRFGNVLASRGSVVPIFEEQLRHGGPLTVTDPEVTRYFMTIPEAARLVLQAQAIGRSGDIFVLEMGEPVKIVDLARKMIALSGVPSDIEFIGLRPGEKLHERLTTDSEQLLPTEREKILRVDRVSVQDNQFAAKTDELIGAALRGDELALGQAIEKLEPGFTDRDAHNGNA